MAADDERAHGISRARLEAFSDGVMAVAITILVLGIDAPRAAPGTSLWSALDAGTVAAIGLYVLSFAVIARFWFGHHATFTRLPERVPARAVAANFAFLCALCLVPFITTLYADNADDMVALVLYAGGFALVSVLLSAVAHMAGEGIGFATVYVPIVFLAAIPLALIVGPSYAPLAWVLLAVLPAERTRRLVGR